MTYAVLNDFIETIATAGDDPSTSVRDPHRRARVVLRRDRPVRSGLHAGRVEGAARHGDRAPAVVAADRMPQADDLRDRRSGSRDGCGVHLPVRPAHRLDQRLVRLELRPPRAGARHRCGDLAAASADRRAGRAAADVHRRADRAPTRRCGSATSLDVVAPDELAGAARALAEADRRRLTVQPAADQDAGLRGPHRVGRRAHAAPHRGADRVLRRATTTARASPRSSSAARPPSPARDRPALRSAGMEIDLVSTATFAHGHPWEQYRWLRENAPGVLAPRAGGPGLLGDHQVRRRPHRSAASRSCSARPPAA